MKEAVLLLHSGQSPFRRFCPDLGSTLGGKTHHVWSGVFGFPDVPQRCTRVQAGITRHKGSFFVPRGATRSRFCLAFNLFKMVLEIYNRENFFLKIALKCDCNLKIWLPYFQCCTYYFFKSMSYRITDNCKCVNELLLILIHWEDSHTL